MIVICAKEYLDPLFTIFQIRQKTWKLQIAVHSENYQTCNQKLLHILQAEEISVQV